MDPVAKAITEIKDFPESSANSSPPMEKASSVRIDKEEDDREECTEDLSPDSKKLIEQAEDPESPNEDLRKRLIDSKLSRKQAEAEKQALLNRIQLLKIESLKASFFLFCLTVRA